MSSATTRPPAARAAAPATMNAPMPPQPMIATARPGPRQPATTACRRDRERLGHRRGVVVAPRPGTARQMAAGEVT